MRSQDFRKLTLYVTDKQCAIYNLETLASCTVFMKNDPKECRVLLSNDTETKDFTFFEHDDYLNTKFELDFIFKKIFNS